MMHYFYTELNFLDIAKEICADKNNKIFLILGEYKQGKTSALNLIQKYISDNTIITGEKITLSQSDDPLLGTTDFFPFISYLADNENLNFAKLKAKARIVFKNVNKVTQIIDELANAKSTYSAMYNAAEIAILEDLEKITHRGASVFFCDDIDKWDDASQSFIKKLMMDTHNRWIKKSIFILTATDKDIAKSLLPDVYNREDKKEFTLSNLSIAAVKTYLRTINCDLNIDELYEITRGNLGETLEFIEYFRQVGNIAIFKNIQVDLEKQIKNQIHSTQALTAAMNVSAEEDTNSTLDMINRSSIIGEKFRRDLLLEFTPAKETFSRCLTYAIKSGIYGQMQRDILFVYHSIYKRLNEINKNNVHYHLQLAKALQKIVPSNFKLRAEELLLSGCNDYDAAIIYFNYAINFIKKYQQPLVNEAVYAQLLSSQGISETLKNLQETYKFYYAGDYERANRSVPNKTLEPLIDIQIDYIHCLILVNGNVLTSDYREAQKILLPWVEDRSLQAYEPYLWIQCAVLYDEIMSETENCTKLNYDIISVFNKYAQTDPEFCIEYYDFLSKNNYTYRIDIQYSQTQQAVAFFKSNAWMPGKALLAKALVNHAANAIVLGKYEEAIQLSHEFFSLLIDHRHIQNYLFTAANNYFIALFLSGKGSNDNANLFVNYYEKIIYLNSSDKISDILLKINYGLMLFAAGEITKSLEVYSDLYDAVAMEDDADEYYKYYIINNYYFIAKFANRTFDSFDLNLLDKLNPYPSNAQFFRRHTQAVKVLAGREFSKEELFSPIGSNISGPAWSFWGRPLLFTDIQCWSD